MCGWQQSSVYEGSTAPPYQCVWLKPNFNFKTLIEISIMVNMVANPIYFVVGYAVHEILLATTHEDVRQQQEDLQERRKSVQFFLAAEAADSKLSTGLTAQRPKKESPQSVTTFSTTLVVDASLTQTQLKARRLLKKDRLLGRVGMHEIVSNDKFDCPDAMFEEIESHAAVLNQRLRDQFLAQWCTNDAGSRTALVKELDDVKKCADKWIVALKTAPPSTLGMRLLQLFVQDLIGRSSSQASIFANQLGVSLITEKRVVTWGVKCLTFTALCVLNCFFIFMCILYGRSKGTHIKMISCRLF